MTSYESTYLPCCYDTKWSYVNTQKGCSSYLPLCMKKKLKMVKLMSTNGVRPALNIPAHVLIVSQRTEEFTFYFNFPEAQHC